MKTYPPRWLALLAIVLVITLAGCSSEAEDKQNADADNDELNATARTSPHDTAVAIIDEFCEPTTQGVFPYMPTDMIKQSAEGMATVYDQLLGKGRDYFVKHAEMVAGDKNKAFDQLAAHLQAFNTEAGILPEGTDHLAFIDGVFDIIQSIEPNETADAKIISIDELEVTDTKASYVVLLEIKGKKNSTDEQTYLLALTQQDGLWYFKGWKQAHPVTPIRKPDQEKAH